MSFFEEQDRRAATPVEAGEIAALPDDELDDRVWLRLCTLVRPDSPLDLATVDPGVRAYCVTRLFEWEVMNGGLHQYFFNHPDQELLELVLDSYPVFGLERQAEVIRQEILPIAARESAWRESLRDGTLETFFGSYVDSALPELDDRIELHDAERIAFIRAHAGDFAI